MISVMFVDDDPNLLQGLRRMLRPMRGEWDMAFAEGAAAALELLGSRPVDVVVTDMRMPGMDGAELLERVRNHDPGIARIVLSGQTDKEAALRATGVAHRFLSKPCDADDLKAAVSRSVGLRELMSNDEIRRIVGGIRTLPTLPEVYRELSKEMASEDMSIHRVGEIVSRDMASTVKILQLVNSAFFCLPRKTENIGQAVGLLGAEVLRGLALSASVFSSFEGHANESDMRKLWEHSVLVASVAAEIARSEKATKRVVDDALQAGMIHDVGRLVLAAADPESFQRAKSMSRTAGTRMSAAESELLGCDHSQIGAYLLGLWALPDTIVEAVAYHHDAERFMSGPELSASDAVFAAHELINSYPEWSDGDGEEPGSQTASSRLPESKAETWRSIAADVLAGVSSQEPLESRAAVADTV